MFVLDLSRVFRLEGNRLSSLVETFGGGERFVFGIELWF